MKRQAIVFALFIFILAGPMGGYAAVDGGGISRPEERAAEIAERYLQERREGEFLMRGVFLDTLGQAHVRLDQQYRKIPVFEGQIIVHIDLDSGQVRGITDGRKQVAELDVSPELSPKAAERHALKLAGVGAKAKTSTQLMVLITEDGASHLAWQVRVTWDDAKPGPVDWMAFIDANTGDPLLSYDNLHTGTTPAIGTAYTLYDGTVDLATESYSDGNYGMRDPTRGGNYTTDMLNKRTGSGTLFIDADNFWGSSTNKDRATAGTDAHFGATMTWDYFASQHDRDGVFDDADKGVLSRVHYGRKYVNAFWSDACGCMTYGDGDGVIAGPLVSLDIAAHEMTHGITSRTADLTYIGESGGLNESISDIFATAVEFYTAAQWPEGQIEADYWLGEDVWTPTTPGDALRYMDHPTQDGRSIDHYSMYVKNMDVHYSSGLANNVYYLLSEGGTNDTSGISVEPIGRERAEAVFYRALTVYMTPGTTFAGARQATLTAAQDLYATEPVTVERVADAWRACGVY
jgi:zinc metalloprotease ZmpA